MKYYTVDRKKTLSEGVSIELEIYKDIEPPEISLHVSSMFPDGVSSHGEQYLLQGQSSTLAISPNLELIFEYVRLANHFQNPSRFQCLFAVKTLKEAKEFRSKYGTEDLPIYTVESNTTIKADMNLLTAGGSILSTSYLANQYWSGAAGENTEPFWEYLLKLPVEISKRVA